MKKACFLLLLCCGCTAVERASFTEHTHNYKITLGQPVHTNGMPDNETKSDGFRFVSEGKLFKISGDVIIEQE